MSVTFAAEAAKLRAMDTVSRADVDNLQRQIDELRKQIDVLQQKQLHSSIASSQPYPVTFSFAGHE